MSETWEAAFDDLVGQIADTPIMSPDQGRRIWQHFLATEPETVLDIGTCYGASAAYMAGALRYLGRGRVVTVDTDRFDDVSPARDMTVDLLARCGLSDLVEIVRMPHSSYAWWLLEELRRATDGGAADGAYDFVYLDGAKTFVIDASSVVLAERLLRPGGWLLLDDLPWRFADHEHFVPETVLANGQRYPMSDDETSTPQLQAVFDHVVRGHPNFDELRIDPDGEWAWARKGTSLVVRVVDARGGLDAVPGRALARAAAGRLARRTRTGLAGWIARSSRHSRP